MALITKGAAGKGMLAGFFDQISGRCDNIGARIAVDCGVSDLADERRCWLRSLASGAPDRAKVFITADRCVECYRNILLLLQQCAQAVGPYRRGAGIRSQTYFRQPVRVWRRQSWHCGSQKEGLSARALPAFYALHRGRKGRYRLCACRLRSVAILHSGRV